MTYEIYVQPVGGGHKVTQLVERREVERQELDSAHQCIRRFARSFGYSVNNLKVGAWEDTNIFDGRAYPGTARVFPVRHDPYQGERFQYFIVERKEPMNELKKLTYRESRLSNHYRHDCERIRDEMHKRGFDASLADIYKAWSEHSETFAAGWMGITDDPDDKFTYTYQQAAAIVTGILERDE